MDHETYFDLMTEHPFPNHIDNDELFCTDHSWRVQAVIKSARAFAAGIQANAGKQPPKSDPTNG